MPNTATATTGKHLSTAEGPPGIRSRSGAARLIQILALCGWLAVGFGADGRRYTTEASPPPAGPTGWAWFGPPPAAAPRTVGADAVPLSVAIPAIGVRSPLLHLGLNADGTMEVPAPGPNHDKPGWYRYSPTPGALGPSVIVGHVDSAADGPSVFYRLADLRPRDTVLVTRTDGLMAVFVVNDVRRYPKRRFPTALVYGDTDHAALRLITCGGAFDRRSGHYLDNIVVRASLVELRGSRRTG